MRAARWHGRGDVRVEDLPEVEPGPGEVKVRVAFCGICGSDLHEYLAGPIFIPVDRPHLLTGRTAPVVLGHEFAGEVVGLGDRVHSFRLGDLVTADACLRCLACPWCRRDEYNRCVKSGSIGLVSDGAFAEFVVVPAYTLYRLPAGLSMELGALAEPTAVAVHAVKRGGVRIGDIVVVFGAGPIGLLVLQAARVAGATRVVVVEPSPARGELARQLGADEVLDPRATEVPRHLRRTTDGVGADVVFECVGRQETLAGALETARRGGRVVVAGVFERPVELAVNRLVLQERELVGSLGYAGDFPAALDLLSQGRVQGEPLITSRIGLEDIVEGGFEALRRGEGRHVKILVHS